MKHKYFGIVCLLYSLLIIGLLACDILNNYLAPSMQIYIKISVFILLFIWIFIIINKHTSFKFKASDLILLLPLVLIFVAGDGKLSTSLASNRSNNIQIEVKEKEEPVIEQPVTVKEEVVEEEPPKEEKEVIESIDFDVKDESYIDLANYMTYNKKSVSQEGKTIRVRGYALTSLDYLPKGYFAIGKYGVSCCTADASFTGFVVKEGDFLIEENKWYEIEGYLERLTDLAGFDILSIRIVNIKEIDSNDEEVYVYPCYSYDDGKCEEIRKYNIQF